MLARHMVGYAPSLIVPGVVALASLTFFTHLMSQAEYGQYSLAIAAMTMLVGVCFSWLQNAVSRLLPQAVAQGNEGKFLATVYGMFAASGVIVLVLAAFLAGLLPLGDWRVAAWFAPPLAVLRALLNINQAVHRNFVHIARYNVIEIGQSVVGLAAALALIALLHRGASDAALGLMIGLTLMAAFDWRILRRVGIAGFDARMFEEIVHFGLPFIANFGFSFILAGSDRFLIEHFLGPDQVGIYSAGYAFPDRIGQYLFMAVATASLPLVVRRLEREGIEAARAQTYINGVALLALAVPACAGMLLVNREIAATLIGPAFRDGAAAVMPLIALATIFNGVSTHYFDHAFHLAKKTRLYFYTLGPAALFNLAANLYAIPRYGIIGAAWTTLAAYALYLVLSIAVGRRVFRIAFPFKPALQIAASAALMALALSSFAVPENALGLAIKVAAGAAVYGLGLLAFDVMGIRVSLSARLGGEATAAQKGTLSCKIVTLRADVEALAGEWRDLHRRVGRGLFGGYDWFHLWLRHLGQTDDARLHIAVARAPSGEVKALLPLVVRRAGFLRILEWAGREVFDYGEILAGNESDAAALWRFVCAGGGYDVALVKDVPAGALSLTPLAELMRPRRYRRNYFLALDFSSGEAWLATQSRKLRGDARRKSEKMQSRGPAALHIYEKGGEVPVAVINALCAQKESWLAQRGGNGVFARPEMKGFVRDLAQDAARQGALYLAWLTCGDAVVACHMGFLRDGVLHLYLTTYDSAYGAYSPGNILMIETIKWAIDAKLSELDFMRGDEEYKQRFASGHRVLTDFIAGRSWIGKIAVLAYSLRSALRARGQNGAVDRL